MRGVTANALFLLWIACIWVHNASSRDPAADAAGEGPLDVVARSLEQAGTGAGARGRAPGPWLENSRLRSRRISDENALPGNAEWWRPYRSPLEPGAAAHNAELDRQAMSLEGFSARFSVQPGSALAFKVDYVSPAAQGSSASAYTFSLRVYRLGYYGGAGARLVETLPLSIDETRHPHAHHSLFSSQAALHEHSQPDCLLKAPRLVDCSNWADSASWAVPELAVSGVYVAVPHAQPRSKDGPAALTGQYIPFVVTGRPGQGSALLVKTSDLTWVAYNKYGGWNLYEPPLNHTQTRTRSAKRGFEGRAVMASYNRPWHNRLTFPLGQAHNFLLHTEFPLLFWLERMAYDVAYASCSDFERMFPLPKAGFAVAASPSPRAHFARHRVFISSGHDEYWTARLRAVWAAARDAGTHLAFFSGNEMFWRVGWYHDGGPGGDESTIDEKADFRTIFCRKESLGQAQPGSQWSAAQAAEWTGTFTDPRQPEFGERDISSPPNALTGQVYMVNAYRNDPMEVPSEYASLRFWRHASFPFPKPNATTATAGAPKKTTGYRTAIGLLGYEWDAQTSDRFRPAGLISLSRTWVDVRAQLMQGYGAAYAGSGTVRHSLSLYRNQTSGALVFATGTCQWAWALAPLHDYSWDISHVPMDVPLQQATLNVLADMGALPWQPAVRVSSLPPPEWQAHYVTANPSSPLVAVYPSSDSLAPGSSVTWPQAGVRHPVQAQPRRPAPQSSQEQATHKESATVRVRGTATDQGGGVVALVEVSADGGQTWGVARGRGRWQFHLTLHFAHALNSSSATLATRLLSERDGGTSKAGRMGSVLNSPDLFPAASLDLPMFPEFAAARERQMYVTYHAGMPRFNLDVCFPRKRQQREWVEVVSLQSRATDDSGWIEGEGRGGSTSRNELLVHCKSSDDRLDESAKVL